MKLHLSVPSGGAPRTRGRGLKRWGGRRKGPLASRDRNRRGLSATGSGPRASDARVTPASLKPTVRRALGTLLLAVANTAFCAAPGSAAAQTAPRIVSIGGSVTEFVYALEAGDRLIAVDATSRHPPEATVKPNVGYMRALSAEPILALEPSLVLAVADAGPPAVLEQLRAAGVRIATIPDDPDPAGILDKARAVAAALGVSGRGEALVARLSDALDTAEESIARVGHRPRVLFLLSVGRGAPLAAGTSTSAQAIIELAGGINAISEFEDYKPISPEAFALAAPDHVLVTERTLERMGGESGVLAVPGLAITPAGRAGRLIAMDGLLLLGFGPRTPQAVEQLASHLHPELRR